VADGFCPRCGSSAPVAEYLAVTRERGGILVLDDTQALGILGHSPAFHPPYGTGGGGSLPWSGCRSAGVMLVSSMAKAFGVPLAIVAGAADAVRRFERSSDTRVHCSPPAVPTLHAAGRALAINRQCGNALRQRLAANVFRFRARLAAAGFDAVGGAFPVQTLRLRSDVDAGRIHDDLQRAAVRSVLRRGGRTGGPLLTFIVTARHSTSDLDQAVDRLSSVVKPAARQLEVVGHDA
jgi:8-amino-7-oxononanoate synthase